MITLYYVSVLIKLHPQPGTWPAFRLVVGLKCPNLFRSPPDTYIFFLEEVEWSNQTFVGPGLQRFIGWPRPWQLGNDEYITLCNFGDRSMTQLMFWRVRLALTRKMTTALILKSRRSLSTTVLQANPSLLTFSFCLISMGLSLSNEANKMKFLKIYWKSIEISVITEKLSPI